MTAREAVGAVSRIPVAVVDGTTERLKAFVADVNSTNLIITSGLVVGMLTALVFWVCMLAAIPIQEVVFGLFLGFVASWIGFGVRQFRVKRETHAELGPAAQARRASGTHEAVP